MSGYELYINNQRVEIFEDETIQFWDVSDLTKFIDVIKKNTI